MGNVDIICLGKMGEKQMKFRGLQVLGNRNQIFDAISFENVAAVATEFMQLYAFGKYDRIELGYNQFKNAAVQIQTVEQFLPVVMDNKKVNNNTDYIYEPSQQHIIKELIPRSLKIQFYKAILDSNAAEHGARMTAMHQATDNATELLNELTLQYNKARQATITGEILEIVSGAEALKG
jgi:F-type H+-transporting ATPase subunit gamma